MNKHSDCKNFTSFDVFKGFCRRTNGLVLIDTPICNAFTETAKCRNCAMFTEPNTEEIGTCTGLKKAFWAYGDMNAKTCEGYATNSSPVG